MKQLGGSMNKLLADLNVLYVKTHNYHYNVVGLDFKSVHVQLEEEYDQIHMWIDQVAEDMKKGLIDRFRSLPISRGAVIIGRTFGDALLNILVLVVMALAGFAVGWRPTSGILQTTLAFLFLFMFGYALSWIGILVGLSVKEARTVQSVGFLVTFPLTFLSNAFAPTTGMPRALQYFAEWNPVSTMVAACRQLFGLENRFGATADSWPSQYPLETSLFYMVLLMVIFIPLSIRKYKNFSS